MYPPIIKVIVETAALYIVGGVVSHIPLSAMGGSGRPLAVNLSQLVLTGMWLTYIAWVYKRDSLGSIWTWGRPSSSSKAAAVGLILAFMIGRGSRLGDVLSSVQMVFRPSDSVRLAMCVLIPIGEEVFWRGLFLRRLSPIAGTWPAIAISAVAFGLVHSTPLTATAMGVALGWLYSPLGAGNLYVGMLFHSLVNLTSPVPF